MGRRLVEEYSPQVLQAAADALPWMASRLNAALESYNLSQVLFRVLPCARRHHIGRWWGWS